MTACLLLARPQEHELRIVVGAPLELLETIRRGERRRLRLLHHDQRAGVSQPPSRSEASAFSASPLP